MSLLATIADQQIVASTAATLSFQGTDSDGEPADPGTVTVGVVDSAGAVVVASGTATIRNPRGAAHVIPDNP